MLTTTKSQKKTSLQTEREASVPDDTVMNIMPSRFSEVVFQQRRQHIHVQRAESTKFKQAIATDRLLYITYVVQTRLMLYVASISPDTSIFHLSDPNLLTVVKSGDPTWLKTLFS